MSKIVIGVAPLPMNHDKRTTDCIVFTIQRISTVDKDARRSSIDLDPFRTVGVSGGAWSSPCTVCKEKNE